MILVGHELATSQLQGGGHINYTMKTPFSLFLMYAFLIFAGDVDGAKTKLFDISKDDESLVPGSTADCVQTQVPSNKVDCVVELGSSPLSGTSYSQWSNDDVIDIDSASEGDGVIGEAINDEEVNDDCISKPVPEAKIHKLLGTKSARHSQCSQRIVSHKNVAQSLEASTTNLEYKSNRNSQRKSTGDEKGGKIFKVEGKVDKNMNFLKHLDDACNYEQEFVYEGNDKETFDEEGSDLNDMLACNIEDRDMSDEAICRVDIVDLLDDSSNSVHDINDILDKSRSISEMINDVLESDDVDTADANESNTETNPRELNDHMTFNASRDTDLRTADSGDVLIDIFTNKSKKESAILSLRNTPDKSPDSDSSSDWEILKNTLTQPAFGQKDVFQTNVRTVSTPQNSLGKVFKRKRELKENGAKLYAESMKTPTKPKPAVLVQDIINSEPSRVSKGKAVKAKYSPKGFFATKMLQNVEKKMSISDQVDPIYGWGDSDENDATDKTVSVLSQDTTMQKINTEKTSKANKTLSIFELTQSKRKIETGSLTDVIDHVDNVLKVTKYSSPIKSSKESDENNCDMSTVRHFRFRSAKLLASAPSKEEPESAKKKPTTKRRLGKNAKKHEKEKKLILSLFEPEVKKSKEIHLQTDTTVTKSNAITIQTDTNVKQSNGLTMQTDSESSDCEKVNKVGKFKRCCMNCTERNRSFNDSPISLTKMHDAADVNETHSNLSLEDEAKGGKSSGYLEYGVTPDGDNSHGFCSNQAHSISNSQTLFSCQDYELNHDCHTSSMTGQCQYCSVEVRQIACEQRHKDGILIRNSQSNCHCHPPTCCQHSHGLNCSLQSKRQPCLQHSQGLLQNQCPDCSLCASHRRSCDSENHNLSDRSSPNTPPFNIENVCTLSQNTYTNMLGGFLHENDDRSSDFVNYSHSAKLIPGASCNYNARQNIEHDDVSGTSNDVDPEIEPILQMKRCAMAILMASSRLLYSKTHKSNNAVPTSVNNEGNITIKRSVNDVLMGKSMAEKMQSTSKGPTTVEQNIQRNRGWDRGRGSTNVEVSEEGHNSVKRTCPFYKKIPGKHASSLSVSVVILS